MNLYFCIDCDHGWEGSTPQDCPNCDSPYLITEGTTSAQDPDEGHFEGEFSRSEEVWDD